MDIITAMETEENANQGDVQSEQDGLTPMERLNAEVEEWKDFAQRKTAELENMRRRTHAEKQQLLIHAAEHTLLKMLPVLDDLHAAVLASQDSNDVSALKTGLEMIYSKTVKIFEDSGVKVIEGEKGTPFSVDIHEAMMHMPSDLPEGHLLQTIQRGYMLHEKVLRHAKVITSAGPSEN
ncbi:MAG: nucleotide exchange factor GrpE [Ignavibacteria bacterium]|nr:nucleotide exchange factor GrpE [Ignavibacteria bacterium]